MSNMSVPAELVEYKSADEAASAPEPSLSPEELRAALVKQIEFYFSDANLPTDKFLLKQIQKDPEGYVAIKAIAAFKRVKTLTKDVSVITEALKYSEHLTVSEDGKVRRRLPLPEVDVNDIQRRTVVVENFYDSPTIESVTAQFSAYGPVKVVRICSKSASSSRLPAWLAAGLSVNWSDQQFALVEFASEGATVKAVQAFQNPDNWRTSQRVRHLLRNFKPGDKPKAPSRLAAASTEASELHQRMPTKAGGSGRPSLDAGDAQRPGGSGRASLDAPAAAKAASPRKHHQHHLQQDATSAHDTSAAAAAALLVKQRPYLGLPSIRTAGTPPRSTSSTPKAADASSAAAAAAAVAAAVSGVRRTSDSGSTSASPRTPGSATKQQRGGGVSGMAGSPLQSSHASQPGSPLRPGSSPSSVSGAGGPQAAGGASVSAFIDTILAKPTHTGKGGTPRRAPAGASPFSAPASQGAPAARAAAAAATAAAAAAAAFSFSPKAGMAAAPQLELPNSPVGSPSARARQQVASSAVLLALAQQVLPLTPIPSMDVDGLAAALPQLQLAAEAGGRQQEGGNQRSSLQHPAGAGTLEAAAAAMRASRRAPAGQGLPAEQAQQEPEPRQQQAAEEDSAGSDDGVAPGDAPKRRRRRSRRKSALVAAALAAERSSSSDALQQAAAAAAAASGQPQQPQQQAQPSEGKAGKPGKKDYACWAAATPEFRKEAAANKYGAGAAEARGTSPLRAAGGKPAAPGADPGGVRAPRGPDGTKGFTFGRGKAMAPPPLA